MVLIKFFVNVGPELASKIPVCDNVNFESYIGCSQVNSFFLEGVSAGEIIQKVNNFKCKYSQDYHGIDMCTVKQIINEIVIPLTHKYNRIFYKWNFA